MGFQRRKRREEGAEGMHFPPALFLGSCIGILLVVMVWLPFASLRPGREEPLFFPSPSPAPSAEADLPYTWRPLSIERAVLVRESGSPLVLLWRGGKWKQTALPRELVVEAGWVSDGQFVYGYREGGEEGGRELVRWDAWRGGAKTIAVSTPLVVPRGVYLSPRGRFVLFYLDNRSTVMTEIWVYDREQDVARVVVENLDRDLLIGDPRWLAGGEGQFAVVVRRSDGAEVLLASPLRTGAARFLLPRALAPRAGEGLRGAWRDGESLLVALGVEGGKTRIIRWRRQGSAPQVAAERAGEIREVWGGEGERLGFWLWEDGAGRLEMWEGRKKIYEGSLPAWSGRGIWIARHTALLAVAGRREEWYLGAANLAGGHQPHLLPLPAGGGREKPRLLWAAGSRAEAKDKKNAQRLRERVLLSFLPRVLPRLLGADASSSRGRVVWFDASDPWKMVVEFTASRRTFRAVVELVFENDGLPRTHLLHALWEKEAGEWVLKRGAGERLDNFQAARKYQYDPLFGGWVLVSSRRQKLAW